MNGHLCRCGTYTAIIEAIQKRRQDDGEGSLTMSASEETSVDIFGATLTRGKFVKGAGALVVGLSFVGAGVGAKSAHGRRPAPRPTRR